MCRNLGVEFVDDDHLLGGLDDVDRLTAIIDVEARNAGRPAALARDEGNLAGDHVLIGLAHALGHPRFQDRIGQVGNAVGRLPLAVGNIGMSLVGEDRARTRGRWKEIIALRPVRGPGREAVRSKIRDGAGRFLGGLCQQRRGRT